MYDCGYQDDQMDKTIFPDVFERRNGPERRKKTASGYTYISTVGWICRRERVRRKDHHKKFASHEP